VARRSFEALIFVALVSHGCGGCQPIDVVLLPPADEPGAPPIPGLESLSVTPASARIADDGQEPGETAMFRALGRFADGERDVTDEVAWSIEDRALGSIDLGVLTTRSVGGRSNVVASSGAVDARAEVEITVSSVMIDDRVPPNAADLFASPTATEAVDAAMLEIVYPSDETMFPQNMGRVTHQWRAGAGLDLFQVSFESPLVHLRLYTVDRFFVPDPPTWAALAGSHAGSSVQMTVRGLEQASPGRVYRSSTVTYYYSRASVGGAAYYWSTRTQALMRATLDAPIATQIYPAPGTSHPCTGCHSISRDGRRIAVSSDERLRVISAPGGEELVSNNVRYGWGAFDPTGTRLLISHDGNLALYDAETGTKITDVPLPLEKSATHPDWSPDGTQIALTFAQPRMGETEAEDVKNKEVKETSLALISVEANNTFGAPVILVRSQSEDDTFAFPSFSPDGRYIAYVRIRRDSRDAISSVVYLIPREGGAPVAMDRLNRRVGERSGVMNLGNTMPAWAPSSRPEISWLVFSSIRDYGEVLSGAARDQLWGAAIDTARAAIGDDPSYAAFWLPFQSSEDGNHRALWSTDPSDVCPSTVDLCGNGLDDDCNGAADDSCCAAIAELCGNMLDDDCDGARDEGCGCAAAEICLNMIDDDCDGETDDDDSECGD
jgi:hypothetical protein